MWGILIIAFIIIIIIIMVQAQQHYYNVEKAYIYGYPLVLMYKTCQHLLIQNKIPMNEFYREMELLTPEFQEVVSPNVDTLYITAWLDLSKGPIILHVPNTHGRYYLIEMLDSWTNVFGDPGKKTTGTKEQDFLICGPQDKHQYQHQEIETIYAPTNLVWIIGRILCKGTQEYAEINQLQNQFTLTSVYNTDKTSQIEYDIFSMSNISNISHDTPPQQVDQMSTADFFNHLLHYVNQNITYLADKKMKKEIISICNDLNTSDYNNYDKYDHMVSSAKNKIKKYAETMGTTINGWKFVKSGSYGTDYLTRASVAMSILGANLSSDAIYLYASSDINKQLLNGNNNYQIYFQPHQLPPVRAFWSITLYDAETHLLVPNKINRYAIQSWQQLKYNADQSVTVNISSQIGTNWLPSHKGQYFNLILRMYWPQSSIIDRWKPPIITKL
jgi:hypothetical protein